MIKYIGKKHLNSNFYKQIVLKQESDFVKVRTVVDERLKNVTSIELDTKPITSRIEDLDDYHKIEEIILYFLRNNTICELSQEADKLVITSTSSRTLVLKLGKKYTPLIKNIIDKYNIDRLEYIDKCNERNIHIRTLYLDDKLHIISGTSSYFEGYEKSDKNKTALVLTLASKKGKIATFDKAFITEYIKEVLHTSDKEATIINNYDRSGIRIYLGDKKIEVPEELKREIYLLVVNRNYEISQMNNKQYKLEGIKWKN